MHTPVFPNTSPSVRFRQRLPKTRGFRTGRWSVRQAFPRRSVGTRSQIDGTGQTGCEPAPNASRSAHPLCITETVCADCRGNKFRRKINPQTEMIFIIPGGYKTVLVIVSAMPLLNPDAKRPGMHSNAKRWNEAVIARPKQKTSPHFRSLPTRKTDGNIAFQRGGKRQPEQCAIR